MADFIPGEAYRLDIIGADESIIVDSWQGTIKANVVSDIGMVQVDVSTGKLYGPMIGDIEDTEGNIIFDATAQTLKADLSGSVYDNSGTVKIIDGMTGKITGLLSGNVVDSEGTVMIDTASRTISANSFTGDLYGDVYGNLTTESIVYGTFSGDFNGTAYGEFFGDSTGTHNGDVNGDLVGNVTGNVLGSVTGELLALKNGSEVPDRLTTWNELFQQWEWVGGVGSLAPGEEGDIARGPVILTNADRAQTALRANVIHYDGTEIIKLHTDELDPDCPTAPATIRGLFDGNFIHLDDEGVAHTVLSADTIGGSVIHPVNGKLNIGMHNDPVEDIQINASNFTIESKLTRLDTAGVELKTHTYRGDVDAKQAVRDEDLIGGFHVHAYNGSEMVVAGGMGFTVAGDVSNTGIGVPSRFVVGTSTNTHKFHPNNEHQLEFCNGVLTVPVMQADPMNYVERDAMPAEAGMIIFNSGSNTFQGFNGTSWVDLH